ncbi:hypothetical protein [Streptomyces sp. NPDC002671]
MPPLGSVGDPVRRLLSATEEVVEPRRSPALHTMKASATGTTAGSSAMNNST